jgi:asparagine synthase (glutamine-hydrolysing)
MVKTVLNNKYWSKHQDPLISIDFIGYMDFKGSLFLTADELATFLGNRNSAGLELQNFLSESFLPEVNGNFAFIIQDESKCILTCDFTRNYPLYIINDITGVIVTDHIGGISFQKEHDHSALEEFLLSGFVTGNRTVFKNVKGLQAGEMATVTGSNISFHRYFALKSDPFKLNSLRTRQSVFQEMDSLFLGTIKRMIRSCPDVNNWVVPLSGGHDSRLIISYLNKLGCKNVICFSYGITSSKEAEVSKLAAEALGYKWYFVEYTANDWKILHSTLVFDQYLNYSFNGCCLPHLQDLLALYKLKELGAINNNDVVVPGHTAFTEAENTIVKNLVTEEQALRYVYDKYFTLFSCENEYSRFESELRELYETGDQTRNSFPEFFNWQERQAKFINNSVRAYEFYGLRWRIPFWERDMIDFWQKLNYDDRIERNILFEASNGYLFHDKLKHIPILNKFKKPKQAKRGYSRYLSDKAVSLIVRILNRKASIAEGTNNVFALKGHSVKSIISPMNIYPSYLKKYFKSMGARRPYQVNVNSIAVIYTLRNEVFSESVNIGNE